MKGSVYFIRDTASGAVKIGVSADPTGRLKALQTASPIPLTLVSHHEFENPGAVERYLHSVFEHLRCTGEWFAVVDFDAQLAQDRPGLGDDVLDEFVA
ncbi:MAG: GIY-YIG nuclease family protein [Phycisphaerae bacterium]|nr:GIY-YIG nuclease family protein [Phycisphaerae bacterium]